MRYTPAYFLLFLAPVTVIALVASAFPLFIDEAHFDLAVMVFGLCCVGFPFADRAAYELFNDLK